ncbi:MAG: RDD family protein [Ignavibacteriales bacterium]|nr:RDD family protein [Ignavibacteriales bacterium]
MAYAGFWKRFAAYLIDSIILGVVSWIIILPILGAIGLGMGSMDYSEEMITDEDAAAGLAAMMVGGMMMLWVVIAVAAWLYFALMESSSKQATLGKMALGIIVTDMNGNRLTFGRATGRYFGKILSGMILMIGYIMAAFTEKKQALHDMIAGCLVVNK